MAAIGDHGRPHWGKLIEETIAKIRRSHFLRQRRTKVEPPGASGLPKGWSELRKLNCLPLDFPIESGRWKGAASDEGISVFGRAEGVHPKAGQ